MSRHIHETRLIETRLAKRLLAYAEQQMEQDCDHELLADIKRSLYSVMDTVNRADEDIKHRWQNCLADVLVRENRLSEN